MATTRNETGMATLRRPGASDAGDQSPKPGSVKPRVSRPAKPLPGLPPTPTTDSAAAALATPTSPRVPDESASATGNGTAPPSSNGSSAPSTDSPSSITTTTEQPQAGDAATSAASETATPEASPARPLVPARTPPAPAARKPPVPARRPASQAVPTSPTPSRLDSSSSLISTTATSSPAVEPALPSSPLTTASPSSPSLPSLKTTPSSPASSGDAIPTAAAADKPVDSPRQSTTSAESLASPRSRTSPSTLGSTIASSSSSLLSVFSSSGSASPIDDLEKRLRKVKEKKEKLLRELRRLEEEERELEDKLREAREDETSGSGGRSKRGGSSRRGSQIVRGDGSPASPTATSLSSSASLTLPPSPGSGGGSSTSSPSLGSSSSGVGSAVANSSAATLHRRVGSLVQGIKATKAKKDKKSGSVIIGDLKAAAEKEAAGSSSAPSTPSASELRAPRQFYCTRAGSVSFEVGSSWDVSATPPVKKYAREVRRKKTMLYIDPTGLQVMVPEEKTAKFPLADIKHVGYSLRQFFMIVIKPRRRTGELYEFKTKEGQDIFEWVVALKQEEKRQREAEKDAGQPTEVAPADGTAAAPTEPAAESEPAAASDAPSPSAAEVPSLSPEVAAASAESQSPSPMDRSDLVRWSVAFIAPINLDEPLAAGDLAEVESEDSTAALSDQTDNDDGTASNSGSAIYRAESGCSDVEISSPQQVRSPSVPQRKVDIYRETLLELLATERNYNVDLDLLVELWMAKLKESRLVEPADMSAIFSNIEQIRNLNKVLCSSLEGLDALPMESINVGERFQNFIAYLKLYTQYCSNYDVALTRLTSLKEAKWELPPFLESIQSRKECKNLDLEAYLIKPMQRLTKYPLLIQALLKHTPPTHPDYDNLARCYDDVQKVVQTVNENKRKNENLTKLVQIQQQFLEPGLKLVEATRKFLREGTFPRVTLGATVIKNCTVLLFNDIVVLAVKKKNKYQAKSGKITLRGSYVWEDRAVKNGFTVVGREAADKLTVEAATEQEKTLWMDEVSQALVHLPHNSLIGGSSSPAMAEKFVRQAD